MPKIKTGQELAQAVLDVAKNHKTLYVLGCFGAPMTASNKSRYLKSQDYNRKADRKAMIQAATANTFGFDCVCLIKGLLWGWSGDTAKTYGGATYTSNGVPDIGADQMIKVCSGVSTDFSKIEVGEAVWMAGHIGVYIGNGLAVECTPKWADGVQVTAVRNIGTKAGYNGRKWTKHGKLPYVEYVSDSDTISDSVKPDYTLGMRYLREGCEGEDVRALQILLHANGCPCGTADGIFGKKTGDAVAKYQGKKNLTQDRVAGRDTMGAILGIK